MSLDQPQQSTASAGSFSPARYHNSSESYEFPAFLLKGHEYSVERYVTVKEVAQTLNLPPWKLWRAIKQELLPTYRLLNGRVYLRLSDVERLMAHPKQGGGHDK